MLEDERVLKRILKFIFILWLGIGIFISAGFALLNHDWSTFFKGMLIVLYPPYLLFVLSQMGIIKHMDESMNTNSFFFPHQQYQIIFLFWAAVVSIPYFLIMFRFF